MIDGEETEAFTDDSSAEDVAEAKSLGWKDPAEWKGAPPKNGFVKASEYVERGKTLVPIIRSQNVKLEKEAVAARKELSDFKAEHYKTIENLSRMTDAALKRQRSQLEDKYDNAISAAAEVGDTAKVKELRKEERDTLKEFDKESEAKPDEKGTDNTLKEGDKKKPELSKEVQDTLQEWIDANPWYDDDEDMQAVAQRHHGKLMRDHPNWTLEKNLEETRKYVAKRFPSEFDEKADDKEEEETPRRGSRVEGGSRMGGGSTRSAWSRIPADAQKQADRFIKDDGLFLQKGETVEKNLQAARERYAVEYLGDEK